MVKNLKKNCLSIIKMFHCTKLKIQGKAKNLRLLIKGKFLTPTLYLYYKPTTSIMYGLVKQLWAQDLRCKLRRLGSRNRIFRTN